MFDIMVPYAVKSGDTLSAIAKTCGSTVQYIYNHPENASLRSKRPNPSQIFPGDVVMIPRSSPKKAKVEYHLFVRRYAPFSSFGGGFDGDNRGFSTKTNVTSRTVGVATFGPTSTDVSGSGYSTGSAWVGPWEVRKSYPLGSIGQSNGQVRVSITNTTSTNGKIRFTIHTEGNLPLKDILLHQKLAEAADKISGVLRPNSPRPQGTPDIDTFVDFTATFSGEKVQFEGTVRGDRFPNAEVFVLDGASNDVPLLDYRTKSNEAGPLYRLFGAHAQNRLGSFRKEICVDSNGSFGMNSHPVPQIVIEH